MRKTKNTIKINGQTYDALTGELLHAVEPSVAKHRTPAAGTVIKPAVHTTMTPQKKPDSPKQNTARRHKAERVKRSPQPAKTLMRGSVRKPSHSANSHDKTHVKSTSKITKSSSAIEAKKSVRHIDEKRLSQAKQVQKSSKITKFAKTTHAQEGQSSIPGGPIKKNASIQHHTTTTHQRRTAHQPKQHRQKTTADLLQDALHHATSHTQPQHKKRLSRGQQIAGMSALVVTSGMLLGIVALQSVPSIKMKIASSKAGFSAGLPGYSPAGFHLGDLSYGAGAVAMEYRSNSDNDREFSITQKTSAWDSTTLRDTFVENADKDFRVIKDGGLTIYLYKGNNATWVNQGVWYQVQGNGALSDRQLVDIAKSL